MKRSRRSSIFETEDHVHDLESVRVSTRVRVRVCACVYVIAGVCVRECVLSFLVWNPGCRADDSFKDE